MASRAVPAPLAQLPNALTVLRLALIPLFVALYLRAGDGSSWAAGWVFLVAGVTDQVDGFLARRWNVESQFGKLADPLADRLMIDAAAILLALEGKLPWAGAVIIVLRDALLVGANTQRDPVAGSRLRSAEECRRRQHDRDDHDVTSRRAFTTY